MSQTPVQHGLALPPPDLLSNASLFLDLDGTLVEIASRPDAVRIDQRLHELMLRLVHHLKGRLAVVSGRPAEQVRTFFPGIPLTISGSHGVEFLMPDGNVVWLAEPLPRGQLHECLEDFQRNHPGVLVEFKPFGVALHFRLAPDEEQACRLFAAELALTTGYSVQPGKKVIELKAAATDKGNAVEWLMGMPAMQGTRPVFIGDDETDEAGFRTVARLGGAGILVGPERPTAALYRLEAVEQTLLWLAAAVEVSS